MSYKYVLFDADGTLFDFLKIERYSFGKTMDSFGLKYDENICRDYSEINDRLWKNLENGLIAKKDLYVERFRKLCDKYHYDASPEDLNISYIRNLGGCKFLLENTAQICEKLYGKVHMAIVTNGDASMPNNRYVCSDISKYFEGVYISEKIGFEKPNVEFFDYVFESMNIKDKSEVIIIGDSLTSDIRGGNNAGIDSCYFNPNGKVNNTEIHPTYVVDNILDVEKIVLG